jgi:hypothetical protein
VSDLSQRVLLPAQSTRTLERSPTLLREHDVRFRTKKGHVRLVTQIEPRREVVDSPTVDDDRKAGALEACECDPGEVLPIEWPRLTHPKAVANVLAVDWADEPVEDGTAVGVVASNLFANACADELRQRDLGRVQRNLESADEAARGGLIANGDGWHALCIGTAG